MAQRRMFSQKIVDSDAFLEMPTSSQLLYFHLVMRADDEGFVGSPKRIMKMIGFNDDDLKILIAKRFILTFESGVVVIKHWLIHNTIRMDRFEATSYQNERKQLKTNENKAYTELGNQMATIGSRKLSKDKLSKDNIAASAAYGFESYLKEMFQDKTRHIQIIGLYWKNKGYNYATKEAAQGSLRRDLRAAKNLVGRTDEEILKTMEFLAAKKDLPKWTLETVLKYIDEI